MADSLEIQGSSQRPEAFRGFVADFPRFLFSFLDDPSGWLDRRNEKEKKEKGRREGRRPPEGGGRVKKINCDANAAFVLTLLATYHLSVGDSRPLIWQQSNDKSFQITTRENRRQIIELTSDARGERPVQRFDVPAVNCFRFNPVSI